METLKARFAKLGVALPEILLPKSGTDMTKWAAVACDQFSSEPQYWSEVYDFVGDAPSTAKIILPECYLEDGDTEERVEKIQDVMKQYIDGDILEAQTPGFIYLERKTQYAECRKGLMVCVDLEQYDFKADTKAFVRPTEGTVIDRLPPRMDIRRDALLDMPHIMVLVDDKEDKLFGAIEKYKAELPTAYDFELMQKSGHIVGKKIDSAEKLTEICDILESLQKEDGFLFAVGDGNHSLAAAKGIWEERKAAGASENDPGRYALVEIENIYDSSLEFEPIHRVLFNRDVDKFKAALQATFGENLEIMLVDDLAAVEAELKAENSCHTIGLVCSEGCGVLKITKPEVSLDYEVIQAFLDDFLAANTETTIDYIHGTDSTVELGTKEGNLGILMKAITKDTFFSEIGANGPLPRKTFSMGEADEKRFYIESRTI